MIFFLARQACICVRYTSAESNLLRARATHSTHCGSVGYLEKEMSPGKVVYVSHALPCIYNDN